MGKHLCVHTYTYIHMCMSAHLHTHTHMCEYTHIHTRMCACIHNIDTHTQAAEMQVGRQLESTGIAEETWDRNQEIWVRLQPRSPFANDSISPAGLPPTLTK